MLDTTFASIYGNSESLVGNVTSIEFLACCIASILLGSIAAAVYMVRHNYSKNFVVTLALLPLIVQMVITLVNGNLGAGIAVMGVFNLVRFRSIPGSAKDIGSVFFAMAIGLATGMGFLVLAIVFTVIVSVVNIAYVLSPFGKQHEPPMMLTITVPEDLQFEGMFDDVLGRFTRSNELVEVSTTNMGSLYQIRYKVQLDESGSAKSMIDELRCLNGNLKITLGLAPAAREVL